MLFRSYSATYHTRFAGAHVKQAYWILLGLVAMFIVSLIDYHSLMERWPFFYALMVGLLALVLLVGRQVFGSRRWIHIGDTQFQVSEFVKLVIILALARYFSESRQELVSVADLAKVGVVAGVPMGLILLQPDLGTALTILPVVAVGVFLAGLQIGRAHV